ncbi:hypothetical protein ACFL59_03020 [Planctomycetota bacterium]
MAKPLNKHDQDARPEEALEMSFGGVPYAEIAARVGYETAEQAASAAQEQLNRWYPRLPKEKIAFEVARLDRLLASRFESALKGNQDSAEICLRTLRLRDRFVGPGRLLPLILWYRTPQSV